MHPIRHHASTRGGLLLVLAVTAALVDVVVAGDTATVVLRDADAR